MTSPDSRQRQTEATPVSSPSTPSDKPRSDEAKRLMEQERAGFWPREYSNLYARDDIKDFTH